VKPNERIYVNGAVIKFDRKTSFEFLNDVQFLLESQVLQAADADTPLKCLYFMIQIHLISPSEKEAANQMFSQQLYQMLQTYSDPVILSELKNIDRLVTESRFHEAMKTLRSLYPLEHRISNEIKTSFPFEDAESVDANPRVTT